MDGGMEQDHSLFYLRLTLILGVFNPKFLRYSLLMVELAETDEAFDLIKPRKLRQHRQEPATNYKDRL